MKCPYQTKVIHKPEDTEGYIKHFAEDITEFGDCYGNECPYYYTTQTYDGVDEHCYRAERNEE